jgi:hypothetical protein
MLNGFVCLAILVALLTIFMPAEVKKDEKKRKAYIQMWTVIITVTVVASLVGRHEEPSSFLVGQDDLFPMPLLGLW